MDEMIAEVCFKIRGQGGNGYNEIGHGLTMVELGDEYMGFH